MKRWYTLYTKPQAEYRVATFLQQHGLEIFLPELEIDRGQGPKPFFPRYLFIKIDFGQTVLSQIQWTPGLLHILSFGDRLQPVRDEIIDLIRTKLAAMATNGGGVSHDFKPGDTVRITEGPFADMEAIFEGPTTANQRVQVLLKVLGGSRMQIEVEHLEKADNADAEAETQVKRPRRSRGRGRPIHHTSNL